MQSARQAALFGFMALAGCFQAGLPQKIEPVIDAGAKTAGWMLTSRPLPAAGLGAKALSRRAELD
jgi:hypothetical protein